MHISLHIPPVPPVPLRVTAIKVHMPTQALYDPVEFKEVLTDIWWDAGGRDNIEPPRARPTRT